MTIAAASVATTSVTAMLFPESEASATTSIFDDLLAAESQIPEAQNPQLQIAAQASPSSGNIALVAQTALGAPSTPDAFPSPPAQNAAKDGEENSEPTSGATSKQTRNHTSEKSGTAVHAQILASTQEDMVAVAAAQPETGTADLPIEGQAQSASQAKPQTRSVSHGAAVDSEQKQTEADADFEIAAEIMSANPAVAVPQPVETPKIQATPDRAPDLSLAIAVNNGAARPIAAKSDATKPASENDDADAVAEDSGSETKSVPTSTPVKPQSAGAEAATPQGANIAPQDAATPSETKPKAETPELAAAKAAPESKPTEHAAAPQISHGETQTAQPTQSAHATQPTANPVAMLAAGAVSSVNNPASDAISEPAVPLTLRNAAGTSDTENMDALALRIAARSAAGDSSFQIRLDPPELGRIDVHLKVDSHGNARAELSADKAQTLDLLQRDSGQLERALKEAGLSLPAGLSFSLKGEGRSNSWRDAQGNARGRDMEIGATDAAGANAQTIAAMAAYAYGAGQQRLDIVV